jgi:hypothetical protein
MYNLGVRYDKGEGVARDPEKALEWLRKSAELGFGHAKRKLKKLEG